MPVSSCAVNLYTVYGIPYTSNDYVGSVTNGLVETARWDRGSLLIIIMRTYTPNRCRMMYYLRLSEVRDFLGHTFNSAADE